MISIKEEIIKLKETACDYYLEILLTPILVLAITISVIKDLNSLKKLYYPLFLCQ